MYYHHIPKKKSRSDQKKLWNLKINAKMFQANIRKVFCSKYCSIPWFQEFYKAEYWG